MVQDSPAIRSYLQDFVLDSTLSDLEQQLSPFNIFEAVGAVRQELRHSDFLAFLLDPGQNHGLKDIFLKRFLQQALLQGGNSDNSVVSPLDLDLWDLDGMEVRREWQNIDITLIDSQNKFAVIIENKIDSGEHSGQLKRYQDIVRAHYPEWQIAALFLTPAGELPSEESYVPVSYRLVCRQIEELLLSGRSTIGSEVQLLMTHYLEMLRRHIVDESQAARLAREIYKKHLRALDFIFENRPDRQGELRGFLENLVTALEGMVLDKSNKTFVTFGLEE